MYRKSNINNNLTIHEGSKFNGVKLLPNKEFFSEYLEAIEVVMGKALQEHSRTLMLRFDLHFPPQVDCCDYPSPYKPDVISRFFSSLEAKFNADLIKKKRKNKRVHNSTMRYVWVKEQKGASQPHYHVAIFLNGDTYNSLGLYINLTDNNAARVTQAWASSLGIEPHMAAQLVHFPKDRPVYYLDINSVKFESTYDDAFKRLSYFCKRDTKHYNNNGRQIGYSQK